MNTNDIRKTIEEKISEESKINNFRNHFSSVVDQEAAEKVIEFIKEFWGHNT